MTIAQDVRKGGKRIIYGSDSDRTSGAYNQAGVEFHSMDTNIAWDYDGNSWLLIEVGGARVVNGFARNPIKLTAGTYTANEVKGFHVLTAGTADWSMTGVDGVAQTALPTAGFPVGFIFPGHLKSLTVPTTAVILAFI